MLLHTGAPKGWSRMNMVFQVCIYGIQRIHNAEHACSDGKRKASQVDILGEPLSTTGLKHSFWFPFSFFFSFVLSALLPSFLPYLPPFLGHFLIFFKIVTFVIVFSYRPPEFPAPTFDCKCVVYLSFIVSHVLLDFEVEVLKGFLYQTGLCGT